MSPPPIPYTSPHPGPLLALDVGTRTIGLAICDPLRMLARPLSTLQRRSVVRDVEALQPIVMNEGVRGLVVGLPLDLNGLENRSTHLARQVGDALAQATGLPLTYHDERFSTVEAERRLLEQGLSRQRRKQLIDAAAAAVILQDFLDSSESRDFAVPAGTPPA